MSTPIWFQDVPLAPGNARGAGSLIARVTMAVLDGKNPYL